MHYKATIIGRLGRDPELKTIPSGATVCNAAVAVTETWKDKNGERQEKTIWIDVEAWGKTGENFAKYHEKGDLVYLEGQPGARAYTKDGEAVPVATFRMLGFEFVKAKSSANPKPSTAPGPHASKPEPSVAGDGDDDLPF